MKQILSLWFCFWPLMSLGATDIVIVQGLSGEAHYATQFASTSDALERSANSLGVSTTRLLRGAEATRQNLLRELTTRQSTLAADDVFVLYLIGHGSWDDETYKFNLAGPDITARDLATALDNLPAQTQLIVNTSSASGAMLDALTHERRVLVSATRSGAERHATRFGPFFANSLSDDSADLNKDKRISAAEAFAFAERAVADFYSSDNQLATEHPKILGDRASAVILSRLDRTNPGSEVSLSPAVAAALANRDAANAHIEALKLNRDSLAGDNYQQQLRRALLELALAEETLEQAQGDKTP